MSDLETRLRGALSQPGGASSDHDLNPGVTLAEGRKLTPAAVLVAVRPERGSVILTKRSARLKHHPGQIAFPGGRQDPEDADVVAAALREAEEEIGLNRAKVTVLGSLSPHETVTAYHVTPILAFVDGDYVPRPETGEVAEIFEVPLSFVTDPANFAVQSRYWQGRPRYFYTVPYGPYYIWGATARILRALADRMAA